MDTPLARDTLIDGRYALEHRLGEGAFGDVWRARDRRLSGRSVAIKFLKRDHVDRPDVVARFEAEADALALLQHPNVVGVSDRGAWGGVRYLVTEFVEGESLAAWLARHRARGALPSLEDVRAIFDQVCAGVDAAHAVRSPGPIVHRDLKPDNVLLRELTSGEWGVKVLDFGVAQLGGRQGTQTGALMGTPLYMAPEQAMGKTASVGPWSDVFALGVVLVEMLTLRAQVTPDEPWWGTAMERGALTRQLLAGLREDVPPEVWDVAACALAVRHAERFANAGALRRALKSAWGGRADDARTSRDAPRAPTPTPAPAPERDLATGVTVDVRPQRAPGAPDSGTLLSNPSVVDGATHAGPTVLSHPSLPAASAAGAGAPSRGTLASLARGVVIGAGAALVVLGLVRVAGGLGAGGRRDEPPAADARAASSRASSEAPGPVARPDDRASAPAVEPQPASAEALAAAPLATNADLDRWLRRWYDAAFVQHGAPLDAFYTERPRFRSSRRGAPPAYITQYWQNFHAGGGTFAVDWQRSAWLEEAPDAEPTAAPLCNVPGAEGPVLKVRLDAAEFSPTRSPDVPCPWLRGVYLLRLRRAFGELRICYESWSTREGLCRSCPAAPACQRDGGGAPPQAP